MMSQRISLKLKLLDKPLTWRISFRRINLGVSKLEHSIKLMKQHIYIYLYMRQKFQIWHKIFKQVRIENIFA